MSLVIRSQQIYESAWEIAESEAPDDTSLEVAKGLAEWADGEEVRKSFERAMIESGVPRSTIELVLFDLEQAQKRLQAFGKWFDSDGDRKQTRVQTESVD